MRKGVTYGKRSRSILENKNYTAFETFESAVHLQVESATMDSSDPLDKFNVPQKVIKPKKQRKSCGKSNQSKRINAEEGNLPKETDAHEDMSQIENRGEIEFANIFDSDVKKENCSFSVQNEIIAKPKMDCQKDCLTQQPIISNGIQDEQKNCILNTITSIRTSVCDEITNGLEKPALANKPNDTLIEDLETPKARKSKSIIIDPDNVDELDMFQSRSVSVTPKVFKSSPITNGSKFNIDANILFFEEKPLTPKISFKRVNKMKVSNISVPEKTDLFSSSQESSASTFRSIPYPEENVKLQLTNFISQPRQSQFISSFHKNSTKTYGQQSQFVCRPDNTQIVNGVSFTAADLLQDDEEVQIDEGLEWSDDDVIYSFISGEKPS